jgi:hypothetical protein
MCDRATAVYSLSDGSSGHGHSGDRGGLLVLATECMHTDSQQGQIHSGGLNEIGRATIVATKP